MILSVLKSHLQNERHRYGSVIVGQLLPGLTHFETWLMEFDCYGDALKILYKNRIALSIIHMKFLHDPAPPGDFRL